MMQEKTTSDTNRTVSEMFTKDGGSNIIKYSTGKWAEGEDMSFFNRAWDAMSDTKPLPKYKKKTCYNHKCKILKQWVFDEKSRLEVVSGGNSLGLGSTLSRGVHEEALQRELQESKLISTMAMSGLVA